MKPRAASLTLVLVLALGSCSVLEQGADVIGKADATAQKADAIVQKAEVVRSTFADISEEEEYYIGRSVAALVLGMYPVYKNAALTSYINTMGTAIAYASDRPETFAGYHFIVLDSDELNAMAAPGGFVFVTKGLLQRCRNEEMIASILAHEIGHVAGKHGLQSIKKSRLIEAFKLLGSEAAKKYGPQELAQLTTIFEDVLGDVVGSLVERGYDRKYEYEADKLAVKFGARTGYDPRGLADFLKTMAGEKTAGGVKGWFKTHPDATDRLGKVESEIAGLGQNAPAILEVRTKRFAQAVKGLK